MTSFTVHWKMCNCKKEKRVVFLNQIIDIDRNIIIGITFFTVPQFSCEVGFILPFAKNIEIVRVSA